MASTTPAQARLLSTATLIRSSRITRIFTTRVCTALRRAEIRSTERREISPQNTGERNVDRKSFAAIDPPRSDADDNAAGVSRDRSRPGQCRPPAFATPGLLYGGRLKSEPWSGGRGRAEPPGLRQQPAAFFRRSRNLPDRSRQQRVHPHRGSKI